ncbi:uncharacterized protein B0I36DRAFT_396657 [Microdochium trichocladiopsis]|uniref:non-specific serine/threonine protein kinase n=1 Tax=Microdochium trichocladiopsis TaxID=1682393 RepID=A0A9P8XVE4_9PEZI|nr:uncharacterized protein B0I36DRAFT_396657 [Microdochium trichocladiopsis]KAH7016362.1 hypothetical protein B0I36DRAFT_396657 [Microdochium trichocladiopsis]
MPDQARSQIIKNNPIGNGLDAFRTSFGPICEDASVPCSPDSLDRLGQEDLQNLVLDLLFALRNLSAVRFLRSKAGHGTLRNDLLKLNSAVSSDGFDLDRVKPLLKAAIADDPDDTVIRDQVYRAVTESTPPPRPTAFPVQQTPWLHSTSSFANSSEYRQDVDRPKDANQDDVLIWFADLCEKLAAFAEHHSSSPSCRRRPLAQPNKPIHGSTGDRKLDVGFVNDTKADKDSRCHWRQILVPGELKSNPLADKASKAWLDLGTYAREVLAAQDTRRFVLGFTICGSLMRIWEFDRLGGVASEQFDINKDGLQFVSTVLGFLWMNEEELGFDPTIMTANNERFIEIEREGATERLVIDRVMQRARCIAGRATTCWKAHREGHPLSPLVIKDSWQYAECDEEGELLREVTGKGVVNMARYYHHETVQVHGTDDDIRSNVRGGLDVTRATNYRPERSMPPPSTTISGASRTGRSNSIAGKKRSSSQTGAVLPPNKRSCSTSPTRASSNATSNRVHRRVILRDYGEPIYNASSRSALLAALEGCIEGHESLRKAGFLHRDISINNLMINEDDDNISWRSFLIDLDLAVREQRQSASGAKGKTGTRAFMAIGTLLGEQHSFMHDLESFFWVLFWICIHYNPDANNPRSRSKDLAADPDENPISSPLSRVVPEFDQWNYISMEVLANEKKGRVSHEGDFIRFAEENFTPYYQPLIPWVNRLRKVVFPSGGRWEKEDAGLYVRMKEILGAAQKDPKVLAADGLAS